MEACLVIHMWPGSLQPPGMQQLPGLGQRLLRLVHREAQGAGCGLDALSLYEAVLPLELAVRVAARRSGGSCWALID